MSGGREEVDLGVVWGEGELSKMEGDYLGEGGEEGYPAEVRIFAGWRKGAQMSAVRGSGVEGGLRGVPGRRPAKKKKTQPHI